MTSRAYRPPATDDRRTADGTGPVGRAEWRAAPGTRRPHEAPIGCPGRRRRAVTRHLRIAPILRSAAPDPRYWNLTDGGVTSCVRGGRADSCGPVGLRAGRF